MAYDDNDAEFSVNIRSLAGMVPPNLPAVTATVGGALFRALYEHSSTGLAVGELVAEDLVAVPPVAAVPSVALPALFGGLWVELPPGQSDNVLAGADYTKCDEDMDTSSLEDVVLFDPAFSILTPTIASPTLKLWCESMGGSYSDDPMDIP